MCDSLPRKGAPAPTDADDRFDDSRQPHRTLASNGKQASAIWAGVRGSRRASRTCAFCDCARQHVGAGWTLAALAFAQQQVSDAPTPEYRFARPDVAELASALATLRSVLILAVGTRCLAMEFAQRTRPGLARDCRAAPRVARLAPKPSLYISRQDPPANQPVVAILLLAIAVTTVIGA